MAEIAEVDAQQRRGSRQGPRPPATINQTGNGIIGTERFNYDLARHEILLETGWQPKFDHDQYGNRITEVDAQVGLGKAMVLAEAEAAVILLRREVELRRQIMLEQDAELARLRKQLWLPVERGAHDYVGPTERNPDTGERKAVPDLVHERFHGAVGDILAGRVIPEARRQMQEALKNAPKPAPSIPTPGSANDPRRIGWRI